MIVEDHSLVNEFPHEKAVIEELNLVDNLFHQMFNEYHELDREVHRVEEGLAACDDHTLETLKYRRLNLKDTLYTKIKEAKQRLN